MRIIKPRAISLAGHPMAIPNGTQLMVTSLTSFKMVDREPVLCSDQDIWKALKDVLPNKTAPDLGLPKPRSEWLAFAKAYSSSPTDKATLASVKIMRGKNIVSEKKLFISGPRAWKNYAGIAMPGEPGLLGEPLLLDWSHAFGNKDNPINPRGVGEYSDAWAGKPMHQIDYENAFVASPREDAYPAGFGPLPIEATSRFKPQGTYNSHWRKEEYPAFPSDTPPEQFMLSPKDQRLDHPFQTGDMIQCSGMHPNGELVEWVLPDWRARVYITFKANPTQLIPVTLNLDTLWLIPHQELLGLMWRGYIPIEETDAYDIDLLFGALEDKDEPKTERHYQMEIDVRSGKSVQTSALMAFDDSGLLPKGQKGLLLPEIPQNVKDRIEKAFKEADSARAKSEAYDNMFEPKKSS